MMGNLEVLGNNFCLIILIFSKNNMTGEDRVLMCASHSNRGTIVLLFFFAVLFKLNSCSLKRHVLSIIGLC